MTITLLASVSRKNYSHCPKELRSSGCRRPVVEPKMNFEPLRRHSASLEPVSSGTGLVYILLALAMTCFLGPAAPFWHVFFSSLSGSACPGQVNLGYCPCCQEWGRGGRSQGACPLSCRREVSLICAYKRERVRP